MYKFEHLEYDCVSHAYKRYSVKFNSDGLIIQNYFKEGEEVKIIKEIDGVLIPSRLIFPRKYVLHNKEILISDYDHFYSCNMEFYSESRESRLKDYILVGGEKQWYLEHIPTKISLNIKRDKLHNYEDLKHYMKLIAQNPGYKKWRKEEDRREKERELTYLKNKSLFFCLCDNY